jgi:WD40 repeat protein
MVAVSRVGRWVITVDDCDPDEGIKGCDVGTGMVKIFLGHSRGLNCIDISVDSSLLEGGSDDCTAGICSLETGKLVVGPFE